MTRWEAGPGGLPFLVIETDRCRARLTPYGSQLCEWTPAGQPTSALFLR
jgi:D-hexose-6-phosphate mutarotase